MRLLLVVNPTASSVTPRVRAAIVERACRVRHDRRRRGDDARGHAADARARRGAPTAYDVGRRARGRRHAQRGRAAGSPAPRPRSAPLPGGSTNVFARTLGIALRPARRAARSSCSRSTRGSTRRIGLGVADGGDRRPPLPVPPRRRLRRRDHPARWRSATSHLKRHLAHPAFAVGDRRHLAAPLRPHDPDRRRAVDRRRRPLLDARAVGPYAVVSNSDPYTYVGRRPVTHRAATRRSTDALARHRAAAPPRRGCSCARPRPAIGTRSVPRRRRPRSCRSATCRGVDARVRHAVPWQVDGDYLGEHRPRSTCATSPTRSPLVVPRTPRGRGRGRR